MLKYGIINYGYPELIRGRTQRTHTEGSFFHEEVFCKVWRYVYWTAAADCWCSSRSDRYLPGICSQLPPDNRTLGSACTGGGGCCRHCLERSATQSTCVYRWDNRHSLPCSARSSVWCNQRCKWTAHKDLCHYTNCLWDVCDWHDLPSCLRGTWRLRILRWIHKKSTWGGWWRSRRRRRRRDRIRIIILAPGNLWTEKADCFSVLTFFIINIVYYLDF